MGPVWVRPEVEIRAAASAVFEEHRRRIGEELPGAEVEHVGSTAIPGAWTKGDVDLLARVDPERFGTAVSSLQRLYAIHQPGYWTPTLASFNAGGASDLPVGLQLVAAGSADDSLFGPFRDALRANPALLAEYNALKRCHNGEDYQTYTDVKGASSRVSWHNSRPLERRAPDPDEPAPEPVDAVLRRLPSGALGCGATVKVAYVFSTSGHTASYKLAKMILPQLEAGTHGVEVVGMFFFDDNTYLLRAGDPVGERLGRVAAESGMLLMLCDQCALERYLAEGEIGSAVPKDTVAGVRVGCFPDLYAALAGDPPDQVITL